VLRDLVNATVGFEEPAREVEKSSKSLHRMFSARGNPTMDNLTKMIGTLRNKLGLDIQVQTTPSNKKTGHKPGFFYHQGSETNQHRY